MTEPFTESYGRRVLPKPYAFPVGSPVRAGSVRGVVEETPSRWLATVRQPNGKLIVSTTTDMVLDT